MTFTRVRVPQIIPLALLAGVAILPVGCGSGEDVKAYKVPKTTEREKKGLGGGYANEGPYRILGAMYPADNPEWFFKLPGPTDELTKYEADFDKLLASVSLSPNGAPPEFTTPDGWKRGPGGGQFAVASIKTPDGKYEVRVTSAKGGVLGNLQRWATDPNQLGGKGFGEDDIPKVTTPIAAKGVNGLRVDLRGPHNPATKGGPFMGGGGLPPGHPQ